MGVGSHHGVDERRQPGSDRHRSGHVQRGGCLTGNRTSSFAHVGEGRESGRGPDGDVDEEDPTPGDLLGEHAPEDDAGGAACSLEASHPACRQRG